MNPHNYIIKSFKYDGHLHRTWLENWLVPADKLAPEHAAAGLMVCVNHNTLIREANGKTWKSRIPGITFFIPGQWYNVVALIEHSGIRYYCNISSRSLLNGNVITYIDYDLDVVLYPNGNVAVVDQDEYAVNSKLYRYPQVILDNVEQSLNELLERIKRRDIPFHDRHIYEYHRLWKKTFDMR
jgi:protein associated with RNAse G/E